jgi:hypothetical protein
MAAARSVGRAARAWAPRWARGAARAFSTQQPAFAYEELFQSTGPLPYPYRKLTSDFVSVSELGGKRVLHVEPEALRLLASEAMTDIAHLLRPGHLQQLANILDDPEASSNDRFVALELLKNANVAAGRVLPGCQDTGTAIVSGKRGQYVWTDGQDEEHLSRGVFDTYTGTNLRYSQVTGPAHSPGPLWGGQAVGRRRKKRWYGLGLGPTGGAFIVRAGCGGLCPKAGESFPRSVRVCYARAAPQPLRHPPRCCRRVTWADQPGSLGAAAAPPPGRDEPHGQLAHTHPVGRVSARHDSHPSMFPLHSLSSARLANLQRPCLSPLPFPPSVPAV